MLYCVKLVSIRDSQIGRFLFALILVEWLNVVPAKQAFLSIIATKIIRYLYNVAIAVFSCVNASVFAM